MDVRTLRRVFGTRRPPPSFAEPLHALRQGAFRLEGVLRAFYVFPIFWFVTHLHELRPLMNPVGVDLRWPVAWMAWVGVDVAAPWVIGFGFVASGLGALLPERRPVRFAVFLALLQVLALKFSFGKIHHLMHGWLFATFIFAVFLPNGAFDAARASRAVRQASVFAFGGAQAALGLTYTLAGIGKFVGSAYQAAIGQTTSLHPGALARHVADRIIQTHADSLLGGVMIEYGTLMWPAMLGTLYLQLFALWAVFRPQLHRVWAFGLIGFHVMTRLSMTIDFTPNIFLLGFLWCASPTAPAKLDLGAMVRDLPGLGLVFRRSGRRRGRVRPGPRKAGHADQQQPYGQPE